tara:strand:- start:98 stop:295 length:198 start_codon:yes stop_codon:yes gene_type:complete
MKLRNIPNPSQLFLLKNKEHSEGLLKLVENIKKIIREIFINKVKKYNNEKELRIPIKKRKVISNK